MRQAFIVNPLRTPVGVFAGSLRPVSDSGIASFYRDMRLLRIHEGTIQQLVIAKQMLRKSKARHG